MNVGVVGGHKCPRAAYNAAKELGALIATEGWVLICGGGGGIMEAACRGAKSNGGLTVGILPSYDGHEANSYLDVKIPTGLGYARNILVVRASDIIVAVDGKYGTLSEISFALNESKIVIGLGTWEVKGVIRIKSPRAAVSYIKKKIK
ncbi:MAG: TIGR00725 family protein [Candidatus Omnitrophica bacterium 4484_171]|nr:MAG: TIGR00725 family protein [Candidatus Omnitrophica bacterium 4484_171]RLB75894.1 MAG: TIGR00725 family protein [Deltaproteobacteria bacterium]